MFNNQNTNIMKKIFLLIPVLALSLLVNAANKTTIDNTSADALRLALYYSSEGDTIVMAGGTYVESKSDYIAWKRSNVVIAEKGETVIIKPHVSFRVRNGARAELIGVKIDASELTNEGNYEDIFQAGDANEGNRLIIEGCEIYGNVAKTMVRCASDKKLDSLIINNCYIHNNAEATLRLQSTSLKGVVITNTTIANVANGGSFWCAPIDISSSAADAKVIVDHCTFYHNTSISSSYADVTVGVDGSATSDVTITNCIFAQPESYSGSRAINLVNGGIVRNCLTFNYTKSTNGIQGATVENCIAVDPLFTDAAHGDYSFVGNWTTTPPTISPARGAATDGSDLGDPRWYSAEVLPETNFVAPYAFVGDKAKLSGNIWYDDVNDYLYGDGEHNKVYGTAKWKIHATRACAVKATLNMTDGSSSGHIFRVEILDATGNQVDVVAEPAQSDDDGDIDLPNPLSFPAAGDYTIILHNDQEWSSAKINSITLVYVGGAVVTVPAEELLGSEAVLVDAGHLKVSKLANGDLKYGDNGEPLKEYVYWNINATKAGNMAVTLNVVAPGEGSPSGHNFLVELYSNLSESRIASVAELAQTSATGEINLPALEIPAAGNYIIKLTNQTQWSSAILHSIEFEYIGGERIEIPTNELLGEDAVLVNDGNLKVSKATNGDLKYGDNGSPLGEYVYWNINASKAGNMKVTLNVVAPGEGDPSGHQFLVELYSDLSASPISTTAEVASTSATGARALPDAINIPATGNYIIKLTNQKQWSSAILHSIKFEYLGGAIIEIPANQLLGEEAVIVDEGHKKVYKLANGDLQYDDNNTPLGEYVYWNVSATEIGMMQVTLNLDPVTSSGHNYRVELYDGSTLKDYSEELESDASGDAVHSKGDVPLTKKMSIPAVGEYTIKLINRTKYSSMVLKGITLTPVCVTLDEGAENNSVISAAVSAGGSTDVKLTRTLTSGMYNTICLPFAVSADELNRVFGEGNVKKLSSSTLAGDVLDIALEEVTSMEAGKPYLVKPAANIVNPKFLNVEVTTATPVEVKEGPTTFKGTFIKSSIPASENNLFLGPNNTLYFPEVTAQPIKGLRAWFEVVVPGGVQSIKHARIVEQENKETAVDLIESENNKAQKVIVNGQLLIVKDGVQYNTLGIRVK